MDPFFNLTIPIDPLDKDIVTEQCFTLGADAVSDNTDHLVVLTRTPLNFYNHFTITHQEEVTGWENKWLEDFHGHYLIPTTYIQPSSEKQTQPNTAKHTILLDPRDAFGDGAHPTTQLCAETLENAKDSNPNYMSCLDIGTGTGILAILAEKLGFSTIDACDIEPTSVQKTKENAKLNHCKNISVTQDNLLEIQPQKTYDVVIANILTVVLLQSLHTLSKLVTQDGTIILSGIGEQWQTEFETAILNANLSIIQLTQKEGWLSYALRLRT